MPVLSVFIDVSIDPGSDSMYIFFVSVSLWLFSPIFFSVFTKFTLCVLFFGTRALFCCLYCWYMRKTDWLYYTKESVVWCTKLNARQRNTSVLCKILWKSDCVVFTLFLGKKFVVNKVKNCYFWMSYYVGEKICVYYLWLILDLFQSVK